MPSLATARTLASARTVAPDRTLAVSRAALLTARGGDSGGFLPNQLPGLVVWLDAGQIAQADATTVQTWSDQSGQGNDLSQVTVNARPLLRSTNSVIALPNGKPVVHFDGVNDLMTRVGSPLVTFPSMFLVAARLTNPGGAGAAVFLDTQAGAQGWGVYSNNNDLKWTFENGGGIGASSVGPADLSFHVLSSLGTAHRIMGYVDGANLVSSAVNALVPLNGVTLGSNRVSSTFAPLAIAEVIIYNHTLEPDEQPQIESYLRTKYGTP